MKEKIPFKHNISGYVRSVKRKENAVSPCSEGQGNTSLSRDFAIRCPMQPCYQMPVVRVNQTRLRQQYPGPKRGA